MDYREATAPKSAKNNAFYDSVWELSAGIGLVLSTITGEFKKKALTQKGKTWRNKRLKKLGKKESIIKSWGSKWNDLEQWEFERKNKQIEHKKK